MSHDQGETGSSTQQRIQFIPQSPHSHGETDFLKGPEKEQKWLDFGADNHHDEDEVAQYLKEKVRVLCWVLTSPSNLQSKARHVKATWGKRCNILLFMSSESEPTLPAIDLGVPEGRSFLWGKTRKAFQYVYDHYLDSADWFLKADDDTYVVVENLRHMLADHDASKPVYFGCRFKPFIRQGYMSGGAGYVLSREAVKRFVVDAMPYDSKCREDPGGAEDLEIGACLQNVGVHIEDSRDELGRERFHPFVPELHLIPGLVPKDNWYWEYSYYPAQEGPNCCSDESISFHYVPPNMMYVFEYFIYHLKPFGMSSSLVLPLGSTSPRVAAPGQAATDVRTSAHHEVPADASDNEILKHHSDDNVKSKEGKLKYLLSAPKKQVHSILNQKIIDR